MKIIDCKEIREQMLKDAKLSLTKIFARTWKEPKLVIIQVEGDSASNVYIRNKIKTGEECGVDVEHIKLPNDISIDDLRKVIIAANEDNEVTGVMVQLPLSEHLKKYEQELLDLVSHKKDVDALSTDSIGRLWAGKECLKPCTAEGVLRLLPDDLSGKNVCILGRSHLVGIPLVKMLTDRNATVTLCHSKTNDIYGEMAYSDIIISAIGKPKFIKSHEEFKGFDNQIFIDIGINRDENGKLCGDIDIESFKHSDCSITPTPGGTGILTTAQLMLNVVKAYEMQNGKIR